MKCWLITASTPFCGTEEYYGAYAEENPEEELIESGVYDEIIENLWVSWNHLLDIEDEDCTVNIEEIEETELKDYFPEGCEPDIIYDERNNTNTGD